MCFFRRGAQTARPFLFSVRCTTRFQKSSMAKAHRMMDLGGIFLQISTHRREICSQAVRTVGEKFFYLTGSVVLVMFLDGGIRQILRGQPGQDIQGGQIQLHFTDLLVVPGDFFIKLLPIFSPHEGL